MLLDAKCMDYSRLNAIVREAGEDVVLKNVCGQRFIGAGLSGRKIEIDGVPGNALGAYLNGAEITVNGNAQDAVGDTMNDGEIVINGSIGDAAGYAMRGGAMYVRGGAGYRAGIHMKEYKEKVPALIIGGCAGSFLGEYQAGGIIAVLGLDKKDDTPLIGNFPCTGMHGGKLYLRGSIEGLRFPNQVNVKKADAEDMEMLLPYLSRFASVFGISLDSLKNDEYTVVTPDNANPYKQLYAAN